MPPRVKGANELSDGCKGEAPRSRKSVQAQIEAERKFPVRVRIFVPPLGLEDRLTGFNTWLRERYGGAGYFIGTHHGPGLRDGVLVYLPDVPGADELVKRCDLGGLIDKVEPPGAPRPKLPADVEVGHQCS